MSPAKQLNKKEKESIIEILRSRFDNDQARFPNLSWDEINSKLEQNPGKLWSLHEMEKTGGEPQLLEYLPEGDQYVFCDFSKESPAQRRSLCYDREALESRKKFKPADSAKEVASRMGIDLMTEADYRKLQSIKACDTKTSSWLETPSEVRVLGGAIFGDRRYERVFIYHNGAESYYAARGFRGIIKI